MSFQAHLRKLERDMEVSIELSDHMAEKSFRFCGKSSWSGNDQVARRGASNNIYIPVGPMRVDNTGFAGLTVHEEEQKQPATVQPKVGESTVWCKVTDLAGDGTSRYVEFLEPKHREDLGDSQLRRTRKTLRKCALCNGSFEATSVKPVASRQCINQVGECVLFELRRFVSG